MIGTRIVCLLGGKVLDESTPSFPLSYEAGQGIVINGEAYAVTAVAAVGDALHVTLAPQTFCDDCGMATLSPSDRPLCICAEAIDLSEPSA